MEIIFNLFLHLFKSLSQTINLSDNVTLKLDLPKNYIYRYCNICMYITNIALISDPLRSESEST